MVLAIATTAITKEVITIGIQKTNIKIKLENSIKKIVEENCQWVKENWIKIGEEIGVNGNTLMNDKDWRPYINDIDAVKQMTNIRLQQTTPIRGNGEMIYGIKNSVKPKTDMEMKWNIIKDPQKERKKQHVKKIEIGKEKDVCKDKMIGCKILKNRKEECKDNSNHNGLNNNKKTRDNDEEHKKAQRKVRFQDDDNQIKTKECDMVKMKTHRKKKMLVNNNEKENKIHNNQIRNRENGTVNDRDESETSEQQESNDNDDSSEEMSSNAERPEASDDDTLEETSNDNESLEETDDDSSEETLNNDESPEENEEEMQTRKNEERTEIVALMISKKVEKQWDGPKCACKTLKALREVFEKWIKDGLIVSVLNENNKSVSMDDKWANNVRIVGNEGKDNKRVELFVKIKTLEKLRIMKASVMEILQQEKLWIKRKFSDLQHVTRIGIMSGVNLKHAPLSWCKTLIVDSLHIEKGKIEVRKENVCVNNVASKCLVTHATIDVSEECDTKLINVRRVNELGLRHVSFRKSNDECVVAAMRMNYYKDDELRFVVLHDAAVDDQVNYNGERGKLKRMLTKVETKQRRVFAGIETGSGKHKHDVFVIMTYKNYRQGYLWLQQHYGNDFTHVEDRPYRSTVVLNSEEENKHASELCQHMNEECIRQQGIQQAWTTPSFNESQTFQSNNNQVSSMTNSMHERENVGAHQQRKDKMNEEASNYMTANDTENKGNVEGNENKQQEKSVQEKILEAMLEQNKLLQHQIEVMSNKMEHMETIIAETIIDSDKESRISESSKRCLRNVRKGRREKSVHSKESNAGVEIVNVEKAEQRQQQVTTILSRQNKDKEKTPKKRKTMNHQTVLVDDDQVAIEEDVPLKAQSVEIYEELLKQKQTKKDKVRND